MRMIATRRLGRIGTSALEGLRRWREDRSGATLVQFIVVLPVFVVVVIGSYAMFRVMAARDTLCEATWEAARYLQIEGPHFPKDDPAFDYPTGWEQIATQIMNQELASRTLIGLYPIDTNNVDLWPDLPRSSPEDTLSVSREELDNNLFELQVTKSITNPLGMFFDMPNDEPGMIKLTCRTGGFYEGPPIEPTLIQRGPQNPVGCGQPPPNRCPSCPGCTPTTVGRNTPTVCPVCRP